MAARRSTGSSTLVCSASQQSGHPVRVGVGLVAAAHRHRHHGHQRLIGQGVVVEQIAAQRAGAQGHHHVVDGDVEGSFDDLRVGKPQRAKGEAAVGGDGVVERRARGRARRQARELDTVTGLTQEASQPPQAGIVGRDHPPEGRVAAQLRCRPQQVELELGHLAGPRPVLEQGPSQQLGRRGRLLRSPGDGRSLDVAALLVGVEQDVQQLDARRPIDGGVVDLGENAHQATLEPTDDVPLPQRARPVEGRDDDPGDLLGELHVVARRGDGDLPEVELEVEVGIVDPVGVVEVERVGHQLAAVDVEQVDALLEHLADLGIDVARPLPRLEDDDRRDVSELGRRLHAQEGGVGGTQLFHRSLAWSRMAAARRAWALTALAARGHAGVGALSPQVPGVQLFEDHRRLPAGERFVPMHVPDLEAGPRRVPGHHLGSRGQAQRLHAGVEDGAVVLGVGRIGPIVQEGAQVDEGVAHGRHVPIEDRLHVIRVSGIELAVVQLVVVVQDRRARRGGHRRRQAIAESVHQRLGARRRGELPPMAPARHLTVDETIRPPEIVRDRRPPGPARGAAPGHRRRRGRRAGRRRRGVASTAGASPR